ncbi:hypothetical protein V6N13_042725 [Hibiscus sabdariffa]
MMMGLMFLGLMKVMNVKERWRFNGLQGDEGDKNEQRGTMVCVVMDVWEVACSVQWVTLPVKHETMGPLVRATKHVRGSLGIGHIRL